MAATFTFQFPIIGPLSKKEYLDAVAGFDLQKAFPDQQPSVFYDFRVDPFIQNRVWFTSVFSALHSGDSIARSRIHIHICYAMIIRLSQATATSCWARRPSATSRRPRRLSR